MNPSVAFTVPGDAALSGRIVRVGLKVHTVFPQLVSGETFVTAERDLAADVSLRLAAPGAGWTYQCLWYGALVGSGLLLTLAARLLWQRFRREGHSTQTGVMPLEGR